MSTKRRKHTNTSFTVDVDIEVWELLEALSDEDLLDEVKERELPHQKLAADTEEHMRAVWECLRVGDTAEALLIAERFLFPKFKSLAACEEKLKELRTGVSA